MSRSQTLRRLADALDAEHPGCRARADYDAAARTWTLAWTDGPTAEAVRERLPAGEQVNLQRSYGRRTLAVGAVELSLAGRLEGVSRYDRWALEDAVREHLAGVADPHTAAGRTGALADALLEGLTFGASHSPAATIAEQALDRGLARLLRQPNTDTAGGDQDPLAMSPVEYLTARYARGMAVINWTDRLVTAPPADLVAAATADEDLDTHGHVAVLALLGQMRADLDRLEDAALTRAHAAGTSWARIGAALGITKQSAHARAARRSTGRPTRSSGQG